MKIIACGALVRRLAVPACGARRSTPRKRGRLTDRRRLRRRLILLIPVLIVPVFLWCGFRGAIAWWPYPDGLDKPGAYALIVEDRNGVPLAAFVSADGQWRMPLAEEQISPHLLNAMVAVEDGRFYEHHGVDWKSVASAGWDDLLHLSFRRGASTLTMQVQRLRDPRPRTLWNKLEEAIRAAQIERQESKRQILIEYANRAPFGGNLVGAGAASWRYFGHPCRDLSLGEAALLAGLPQSPNRLRPDRYPQRAMARRNHVLDRMLACGFVTQKQRDEAAAEPIRASWRPLPQERSPDDLPPADGALPELLRVAEWGHDAGIRTTIDAAIQRQAGLAAREQLHRLQASGVSAAGVVILDTQTSQCLAAVNLGPNDNRIDLVRRPRSTGSTLKPFIYAAAFDAGLYGPQSILSDTPAAWPGYQPADYDRLYRGELTAAEALAQSRNIPAMVVLSKVGVETAVGIMDAAGLHQLARNPGRYGLSLAVGGADATPMELAQGYAALGRGGIVRPIALLRDGARFSPSPGTPGEGSGLGDCPRPGRGEGSQELSAGTGSGAIYQGPHPALSRSTGRGEDIGGRLEGKATRCLRAQSCWQVLNALAEPSRTTGICPEASRSHVAWKTGTSSGHCDAWCAAVTHRYTVVVWMGNPDGQSSPALVGQEAAAPLALQIISILDPADEPWPIVEQPSPRQESTRQTQTKLVLIHPINGQQIVLTADAGLDYQRVLLQASSGRTGRTLWWFVDGHSLASTQGPAQCWWVPTAGTHEIRVLDATGHAAAATVQVRLFQ